jgi:HAD superfamily hydrolase (TIGR01484 family)
LTKPFEHILILSDFDGTFAGTGSRIVPRNMEAIARFQELGGHFTFSTGRLPSVLSEIFPDFRRVANAPVIMSNGAILYEPQSGKILKEFFFDGVFARKAVKDILSRFPEMEFVVYPDDGILRRNLPPDDVPGDRWRKMRFYCEDEERVLACRDYIKKTYREYYNCFRSFHTIAEVVGSHVTKGNMIALLRDYFAEQGLTDLLVCCIGDYENDVDMLKSADVAFCPSNAIEAVKAVSHHVLCHHDNGAIADMITVIEREYTGLRPKPHKEDF